MRYVVHTPCGARMLSTDSAQTAGDECCTLIEEDGHPCAYYHDTEPGRAYPYIVYQHAPMSNGWTADAFATLPQARGFMAAIAATVAACSSLPVNRYLYDRASPES